jgi:hypothetical protein
MVQKEVSFNGLTRISRTPDSFHGRGDLIEVQVEGWKAVHYALEAYKNEILKKLI